MTIKSSGSLSMSEINAEFGYGTSLSSYRGQTWWTDAGTTGTFPSTGSSISISNFYGKRKTAPTIPVYFLIVGGGGGGAVGTADNVGGGGGGGGGGGIYQGLIDWQIGTSASTTVGAGGAAGVYGDTGGGYGQPAQYYLRAGNGIQTSFTYGSYSPAATGGQRGLSRYYWTGSGTAQETNTYRGGDSGYPRVSGSSGPANAGGGYHSPGASGNSTGGGGGGGVDDATNTNGYGGDGQNIYFGTSWVGRFGGGGGGGGDYNGGAPGGAGGGGGHGGTSVSYPGLDGYGGGGAGGDSYGGGAFSNGAKGGDGTCILAHAGSTQRLSLQNGASWYAAAYDSSSGLYYYILKSPAVYFINCNPL